MLTTPQGYPRQDRHAAEQLLKEDVDAMENGEMAKMQPRALRNSRPKYQEFPLDVFRNHIYQEERSSRERPYGMYQSQNRR